MSENVTLSGAGRHCKAVRNNGRRPVKHNGNRQASLLCKLNQDGVRLLYNPKTTWGRLADGCYTASNSGGASVLAVKKQ